MILRVICIFIVLCGTISASQQASGIQHWKNSQILRTIVLFNAFDNSSRSWQPWGTGVLIDVDSSLPFVYLVTNRHLLITKDSLLLVLNHYRAGDSLAEFVQYPLPIQLSKANVVLPSTDDSDFAAIRIKRPEVGDKVQFGTINGFVNFGALDYGEEVEFYGFPEYSRFGFFGTKYHLPILRSGVVSYFAQENVFFGTRKIMMKGCFLVDGVSFGGNSGGPVFVRRQYVSEAPNGALTVAYDRRLAGIVSGHLPYMSEQTIPFTRMPLISRVVKIAEAEKDSTLVSLFVNDLRFAYEENADLVIVYSIELITEYIRLREMGK